jgi:hypothetical protein
MFYLIWRCKRRLHPLHGRLAPGNDPQTYEAESV